MIKSLFFIFCCIMPCAAEAGEILNVQDGFKIAKPSNWAEETPIPFLVLQRSIRAQAEIKLKTARQTAPIVIILPAATNASPDTARPDPEHVSPVQANAVSVYTMPMLEK